MKSNRRQLMQLTAAGALALTATTALSLGGWVGTAHALSVDDLMQPQALPDMALGEEDAPVTIVEYASMTCPHCAHFHETTLPGLKEKYIDTGKVRMIFREFPFDPRAAAAFMLARCAPKEQYFPLIDVLWKIQTCFRTSNS